MTSTRSRITHRFLAGAMAAGLAACATQPVVSTVTVDDVAFEIRADPARPVKGYYLLALNDAGSAYDKVPPYRAMTLRVHGDGRVEVLGRFLATDKDFWVTDLKPQPDGLYTYAINRPQPPLWGYDLRALDPRTNTEYVDRRGYPLHDTELDGHETVVYHGDQRLFLYYRRRMEGDTLHWDMEVVSMSAKTGERVGRWTSKGLFPPEMKGDYLHFNSLHPMNENQVLASARSTSTLYVINLATGRIDDRIDSGSWKVEGDPLAGFSRQHHAHFLPNGNLLLYDNRDESEKSPVSRAVEYAVDWKSRTLRLVWERPAEASMPFRFGWGSAVAVGADQVVVSWGDRPRGKGYCKDRVGNFPVFSHVAREGGDPLFELRAPCGWVTYRTYFVPAP